MRSIPSFSGLAIIFFKKGFTSVLTVMRVFVFCSSIATSCIHKNRGMGEFSAVNLMVLFGSRITTRKVSSPTGSTDMVHESASNLFYLLRAVLGDCIPQATYVVQVRQSSIYRLYGSRYMRYDTFERFGTHIYRYQISVSLSFRPQLAGSLRHCCRVSSSSAAI